MVARNEKTKKEFKQNVFFSVLLAVLIFIVVGSLVAANWRISQKRAQYDKQIRILQAELQDLELQRQRLQTQTLQGSDEDYLETQARERFNLKKSGEEVVSVLPVAEEIAPEPEKGFWENFWNKIKIW